MEYPFGHHHHLRRDDDDDKGRRPYPPPGYQPPPPPPPSYYSAHHVSHELGPGFDRPTYPPVHHLSQDGGFGHLRPPPQAYPPTANYGRHEYGGSSHQHHHYEPPQYATPHRPDPPPYSGNVHHISHEKAEGRLGHLARQPTVRIFTRAESNFSLSIRDGNVILAHNNPSDERQHWIKDLKYSTKVKDEEGFPAFSLVNKATGEAIKHSIGKTYPVQLARYDPDQLDESILWTESKDVGTGFRCIRMVNNIRLNFDAFHGDRDHGGVKDGTTVVLWEWLKGDNQTWKIVSHCKY